jgi:autoinducer 2 (AI-2) kinase
VQLKLRADLFDGMLTGRRNAMEAAMAGELSFSGDTARAMTLQHVQRDLSRLYCAAREAAGDPGDLASLPDPTRPSGRAPAPADPSDAELRGELVAVVNELYAAGLVTATGGNVSARASRPDEAWITPSQLFKGDLRPEILVRIGMDARTKDAGARSPSSEALMHTAVLRARPDAKAVIHCHAPNATILVNSGLPFLPVSTEAAFFTKIGRIPFIMPGTQELADAIVEAMGDGWAVLMQNHGLLVAGRSLRRAADMAEIIERTAEVILGCYAVGREPPVLPPETVEMLARYGDLMA